MSLTSHIRQGQQSPIGRFLCERFSQTRGIAKDANRQLQSASTIRPADQSPPYMTLGAAIDYRIRYSFAITPSEQLVAWKGARFLTFKVLEGDLSDDELIEILEGASAAQGPYPAELLESFFHDLDDALAAIQPSGRRLDAKEEQLLARYCYVLALFEAVYREDLSPFVMDGPLFRPTVKKSVQELLAIPQDEWVEDLCAMSWLFYDKCRNLLSQPAVLNPKFQGSADVGGADADLIVDGCLIDLKTSINSKINSNWLRQLAGYLLLDYDDAYQIKILGLYMVRQGVLLTWPVEEFLQALTGDHLTSVAALRQEFRTGFSKRPKPTIFANQSS